MSRGKILVIRGGAIGDFILTSPVLAALRGQFPETSIEVLGYPKVADLALQGGLADAVRPIEARPMAGFFARAGILEEDLQDYFASFALIISFLYDPDLIFQENIKRCSKAQFIAGPHRPNEGEGVHATEVFLKPLERLAIFDADPEPRLVLRERVVEGTERIRAKRTVALHPGSGSAQKNWPEDHWRALLGRVARETQWQVLLVGGEAEGDRLKRLATEVPSGRCLLADSVPLADLALMLRDCWAFVGHDSGITHLAAAVGLSGVVLWGPSNERIWQPRSAKMKLLKPALGLHSLSADDVFRAIHDLGLQSNGV